MTKVIPTLHVVADNIPQAHYRATQAVFDNGIDIRTQYDRQEDGKFIDPPSKDARVLILITNPFNQPRYPIVSYCEIGKYIAEIIGVKDHLVVPFRELKEGLEKEELSTLWPYTYSQRLSAYPLQDGGKLNQLEMLVERIATNPITRRAVAMTGLPEIDNKLKEDMPCLREIHLRGTEEEGALYLHMSTVWRSRDLFKAWHDNTIAMTFLQAELARQLSKKTGREVRVGSYSDYSTSLHIYGQDIKEKGVMKYIADGEENILRRAMDSATAAKLLVIPQLEDLLKEKEVWQFPESAIEKIKNLIADLRDGKIIA
jgi:hypothetical protein